ncbi:recombinase family protein [Streptomyces sp. 184]|uniref:recombinase family protein n=1 Tax=Streptomyces sp. 184 TaxID=1827526 RepID=UPI003891AE60
MRPVIYGYMRLVAGRADSDEEARARAELASYAASEGLTLDQVFIEHVRSSESAFHAMLDALRRGGVKNVLVPSLWHFARLPGLQETMRQHIEQETGARLWVIQRANR